MLSERIINHIGVRIRVMTSAGLTTFKWDKTNKRIILCSVYLYYNWVLCLAGGYVLNVMFVIQLYLKLARSDIQDEAVVEQDQKDDQKSFATLVLLWGELILLTTVNCLATQVMIHRHNIIYIINQSIVYHEQITRDLDSKHIEVNQDHKRKVNKYDLVLLLCANFSYVFPFIMLLIVFHPLEPVHNMIHEWFEFEPKLEDVQLFHLLFLPAMIASLNACGNTIVTIMIIVLCYFLNTTTTLEDMTPVSVHHAKGQHNLALETTYYGVVEDDEIIFRYRTMQLFNVLLNEIVAHVRVSLQSVACLVVASVMGYFAISFSDVLQDTGLAAYVVVYGAILAAFLVQWYVTSFLGYLVDLSVEFRDAGKRITRRSKLYGKFCKSCIVFYVQEAYPFYTIHRDTFLEFCDQVLDKMITLLLW